MVMTLFGVGVMLGAICNGFVLKMLWGWFVVPTFPAAPSLSIPAAIGISLVVGMLTHDLPSLKSEEDQSVADELLLAIYYTIGMTVFYLAMGWVVYRFM